MTGRGIAPARTASDIDAARALFATYAASLGVDLAYQRFADELASLPGRYTPPAGALLLARDAAGQPLGCVALRAMADDGCCEMKRLYVTPAARGTGLGRALVEAAIAAARRIGYREMRLDSLPSMHAAIALYERRGFRRIAPYYDTPVAGTVFLALHLDR